MRTPKIYLVIVAGMIALFVQDSCNAQLGRIQPFQQFGRFLGNGHSVGYHICNPGPDTSYYNPWSHHNSFLIHRTPEYQSRFGNSDVDAYQLLLSGRSPHFQNQPTPFQGFSATPTTVDADFEPIGDDRDDSDSDSNGSSELQSVLRAHRNLHRVRARKLVQAASRQLILATCDFRSTRFSKIPASNWSGRQNTSRVT